MVFYQIGRLLDHTILRPKKKCYIQFIIGFSPVGSIQSLGAKWKKNAGLGMLQ